MIHNFRFIILFCSTIFMTLVYSNRVAFGFTVICQEPENGTRSDYYLSNPENKAVLFTATAVGMCLGPIPLYWAYKLNTKVLMLAYGLISTLAALLYPLADSAGLWPSIISRFFTGFSQSAQLHFSNEVVLNWAPKKECSLFFSILLASSQIGPLLTMILGGEMCSSQLGWQATYYLLGGLTFLITIICVLLYTDKVEDNRFVSAEEKTLIIMERSVAVNKAPVPYSSVFTDLSIWITFILFTGYYIGMIIYQQYSPTFIKQVLNYTIRQTGYFSALPMLFAIFIKVGLGKLIGGVIAYYFFLTSLIQVNHGMGLNQKWRLAGPLVVLEIFSALSIFLTGWVENYVIALIFDLLFASLHFFVPVICSRTIQIIGGQHAHFALNFNMFIAGFIQILIPGGVQILVPNNSREQWSTLFYFVAAIIVLTTSLFVFCTKIEPAEWTKEKIAITDAECNFERPRVTTKE